MTVTLSGQDAFDVAGPTDLVAHIAGAPEAFATCAATGLVSFVQQRAADAGGTNDACGADAVARILRDGGSLRDALVATLAHDGMFYRTVDVPGP